jgi:diguanylate cyclase (GGDEF)-like protein
VGSGPETTLRKRSEVIQAGILKISQVAIAGGTPEKLYQSIHSILRELIPTENFYIALYDPATGMISFPYYVDQHDEKPPGATELEGLTGYVIRSGQPLLATREVFDRLVKEGEIESVGTQGETWMGVPLKAEGRTIGVMAMQSYEQGIEFSQADLNLLEFVSTQVAQSIERKRMAEEIRSLSLTDELTGLHNRRGFSLLAEHEVKLARRMKRKMLLIFCDLDGLKMINDGLGHAEGDLALKEVSTILRGSMRGTDILARLGGDEFVVLAVDASMESAEIATNRIQAALEKRNEQTDRSYPLSLSMGVACFDPETPCALSELIAQADGLMYQQKQAKGRKTRSA